MIDGLRPDTCVIVVDNIRWDHYGENASAFDLLQYGCDGENRVMLSKERIDPGGSDEVGVSAGQLNWIENDVNARLRQRQDCTCR